MKEQKRIFTVSVLLAVVTLILSIAGEWNWIHISNTFFSGHRDFLVSVCLNVFSGTIVGALLALMSYFVAKKDATINYYLSLTSYLQQVNIWAFNLFEDEKEPMRVIRKIKNDPDFLNDTYQEEMAYVDVLKSKMNVSFIRKNSKQAQLAKQSLNDVNELHKAVSEVMSIKALCGEKVPEGYKMLPDKEIEIIVKFNKESGPAEALKKDIDAFREAIGIKVETYSDKSEPIKQCENSMP